VLFANFPVLCFIIFALDDLGCCLKAKCRPTRSDGAQGEIFTSSSSEEVTA
jgi:hypothetical protein